MHAAIGFIGLGEAGYHIAAGLAGAGATVVAYDSLFLDTSAASDLIARADAAGIGTCRGLDELAERSGVLISTVPAAAAIGVAREAAPHLNRRHLFLDLNSVSPDTKRDIAEVVEAEGATFVEGTIMAAVKPDGHRVPIVLAGASAADAEAVLSHYGMHLEILGNEVGAAAALKMCRSVIIKGVEALLLECLTAARAYGVDARVLDSAGTSMHGFDWSSWADYTLGRLAVHGARRAQELDEAARAVEAAGVTPIVSRAAAERLRRAAAYVPLEIGSDGYHAVLDALARAQDEESDRASASQEDE